MSKDTEFKPEWPEWFQYIRVQSRTILGSGKPPDFLISFGSRNICDPKKTDDRAAWLLGDIRHWLWVWIQRDRIELNNKLTAQAAELARLRIENGALRSSLTIQDDALEDLRTRLTARDAECARLRRHLNHAIYRNHIHSSGCSSCDAGLTDLLTPAPESPQVPADSPVAGSGEPSEFQQYAGTSFMVTSCATCRRMCPSPYVIFPVGMACTCDPTQAAQEGRES